MAITKQAILTQIDDVLAEWSRIEQRIDDWSDGNEVAERTLIARMRALIDRLAPPASPYAAMLRNEYRNYYDEMLDLAGAVKALRADYEANCIQPVQETMNAKMIQRLGAMIGSPGDAGAERDAVTKAILQWNAHSGRTMNVYLDPVRWETHATPGLKGRPQGMINEELIPQSDLLIAIFRSRAGSPTGLDVSGTMEEIREFMRQGKYVVVYFYEGEVAIGDIDPEQLKTIRAFQAEIQQHGLTDSYKTVEELAAKVPHHLTAIVCTLADTSGARSNLSQNASPSINASLPMPPATTSSHGKQEALQLAISDSGRWVLLDTRFYESDTVRQNANGEWVVSIQSASAEDDAHLGSLKSQHFGRSRPIAFAHRSDGILVTVKSVESVSEGGQQIWTVTLSAEDIQYGGDVGDIAYQSKGKLYTPDDFARLRAGRILLNDPPPLKEDDRQAFDRREEITMESFIRGSNNPVSIECCIVQEIYRGLGTDSPSGVELVARFVEAGNAQCVMGNHELNIMRNERKLGNRWFFGEPEALSKSGQITPQRLADENARNRMRDFFRTLPLALEREDLRAVHACWHSNMLAIARKSTDALTLYQDYREAIASRLNHSGSVEAALAYQNQNPVKVLTSGLEKRADCPFEASGKTRLLARVPWWNRYSDQVFCVFGHYGRRPIPPGKPADPLFDGCPLNAALGNGYAVCIDYGIAERWAERLDGHGRGTRLGALRFSEGELVFDDGERLALQRKTMIAGPTKCQ